MGALPNREKAGQALVVISFLILIWLPLGDWMWDLDRCPTPNENRYPAPLPGPFQLNAAYMNACNLFFNDHFGFRNQLVYWNTHWKQKVLEETGTIILEGKKGWLYYKTGLAENVTGQKRFTDADLRDWKTALEIRRDWLASIGIQYMMVVAPNKESIYPEYLPNWVVKTGEPVKFDQFLSYMRSNSTVAVVDVRPSLLEAKQIAPTYFRRDTHWNNFGGFIACQQIVQAAGAAPETLDHFTQRRLPKTGDLALCLDQSDAILESYNTIFEPKRPLLPLKQQHNEAERWTRTKNPAKAGKVLINGDSFMDALMPFVGYSFGEVIFRHRSCILPDVVAAEKPDMVIDEMVERSFNNTAPLDLLRPQEIRAARRAAPGDIQSAKNSFGKSE